MTNSRARALLQTRVLIIGTLDLPQCEKYRVRQKQMLFQQLQIDCSVVSVWDTLACMNALQTHTVAIFYRVPGFDHILAMVTEAKRLGVVTIFETDDLIFDTARYLENQNVHRLTPETRESVLNGIPLFRKTLENCDVGIASTVELAEQMKLAGLKTVHVVENGIDEETFAAVRAVEADRIVSNRELVYIFYGSGSKAHDADFECAADSLLTIARKFAHVRIRIVGELTLASSFDDVANQVERYPTLSYEAYLRLLAHCDINLAPLEATVFNDCKSNIKFIEAALFGIPSVCSPRSAFRAVIHHGDNGMLAESANEWHEALASLVQATDLRQRIGYRARQTALDNYSPEKLANRDIKPLIDAYGSEEREPFRILSANIYFSPDSFGGGTIVAEEMAVRLHAQSGVSVLMFSGSTSPAMQPYEIARHEEKGIPVLSVKVPSPDTRELDFFNRKMRSIFSDTLRCYKPHVVHFHSIQGLSASLAEACIDADVPYVVTLHDAWWICERQFMVRPDQKFCGQTKIDLSVCETCVPNISWTELRLNYLKGILHRSAKLLAPSDFWKSVYVANDIKPEQIAVNKNGILPPRGALLPTPDSTPNPKIRFGFVGGLGPIKGLDLVLRAFRGVTNTNYELVIVDNTMNLGYRSMDPKRLRVPGSLRIVPAYTQANIDEFFASIDVLLFPSQWKESFGLTVREALIRDKWVVLTDSGGTVEDVVVGENGTIIPLGDDVQDLRNAITELLADPIRIVYHVNKYKGSIRTFDDQAAELLSILKSVAHGDARVVG